MLIDTHSHISFKAYDADRGEVVKRTRKEGVLCIDVGTKYETSKNVVELAEKNEGIYAAIGMHPIHIKTDLMKLKTDEEEGAFAPLGEEYEKEKYRELILKDRSAEGKKKIVAIGEIGLDYYYKPKTNKRLEQFKELQKKVFIEQLDLASDLDLPVIIHCRMAHEDVIEILENYNLQATSYKLSGVIHCFTGSWEEAQKYIDLGFYLGINGIIFKLDLNEVIKKAPLEKLLVETDCPYLTPKAVEVERPAFAPVNFGVARNEPLFVKHVAQGIAELKGITFDEVAEATTANARRLFSI